MAGHQLVRARLLGRGRGPAAVSRAGSKVRKGCGREVKAEQAMARLPLGLPPCLPALRGLWADRLHRIQPVPLALPKWADSMAPLLQGNVGRGPTPEGFLEP